MIEGIVRSRRGIAVTSDREAPSSSTLGKSVPLDDGGFRNGAGREEPPAAAMPDLAAAATSIKPRSKQWATLRSFTSSLTGVYRTLGKSSSLKPPKPARVGSARNHSAYIEKLRTGLKGNPALFAFGMHANARKATVEAQQQMEMGGIVTSVDNAEDLENVAYWQQGDASLATKEKMAERQALRYHPLVLEALQKYWEAAQRSLQSGGDPSANELHQEGHALMLRRIYRVMIKEFDPDDCERCIAEDWQRDAKGKDKLTRKAFCDAFFELAGEAFATSNAL